jgi:hypothetical protein
MVAPSSVLSSLRASVFGSRVSGQVELNAPRSNLASFAEGKKVFKTFIKGTCSQAYCKEIAASLVSFKSHQLGSLFWSQKGRSSQ